jgi:sigma-54 dependent transcriptional regulator, acetoin dehydrogenase operon transcriptional activator AcoR
MPAAATTHPSASTHRSSESGRHAQLSWIFPATLVTPLTRLQVVGRDEACDTVLAGTEVSRRHAEFRVDGPVVAVRDLDSRNGVFVNGARCRDALLRVNDVVRCGEWIGIVLPEDRLTGFVEISPGWFGGSALSAAVAPTRGMPADLAVIVQGETGTGKEGAARAIHAWSGRAGPFVAVNCAAVPSELAEAELFGYRKGAFTGADSASSGLFRAAHGGSIFLDEILDLPATLQPKLLRVLEERKVRALGETRDVAVDLRIIAATQEPLSTAVANRRFRADLHARLDGLTVVLPPLRDRREDILPLFSRFLTQYAGGRQPALDPKLVEALCIYDWPLNVRELLLLVRRLLTVQGHQPLLKRAYLPDRIVGSRSESRGDEAFDETESAENRSERRRMYRPTDDEPEFDSLIRALRGHAGSVAKAAAAVGMSRGRAYRLLSAHPDYVRDADGTGDG